MQVPLFKMNPDAILPQYQTAGSAGADLYACIDVPYTLASMERVVIPTGVGIALPQGYEAQVRARSGLSTKHGVTIVNGIGTIDSDYRGEIGVALINLGSDAFVIEPRMRIAQLITARYERIEWQEVETLETSERGTDGFGSTGTLT